MRPVRPATFYLLLATGPALFALGLMARLMPDHARPLCLTHQLTGLPCPGCGSFRALCLFTTGHLPQAFLTQPFMTLVYTALALASMTAWLLWLLNKPTPTLPAIPTKAWKWLIAALALALLLNWAYLVAAGV